MSAKKLRGRVMWEDALYEGTNFKFLSYEKPVPYQDGPLTTGEATAFFVLPADAESAEQLVEQVAKALFDIAYPDSLWRSNPQCHYRYKDIARAALKSIGFPVPKTKGKK